MRLLIIILLILFFQLIIFEANSFANNLQLTNGRINSVDTSADTAVIQFNIDQDNSWKDATNNDAIWVFVKYETSDGGGWSHATLSASGTNPSGFSTGTGTAVEIIVPSDLTGCFIQRVDIGSGNLNTDSIQIVWDYGFDNVTDAQVVDTGIKIFALEMVYIPEGAFYVGDGDGSNEMIYALHVTNNTSFQISHVIQNNVTCDTNGNDDIDDTPIAIDGDDGIDTDGDDDIDNTLFPTGYTAFYIMKYELSQGMYVGFLNTLDRDSQNSRTNTDVSTASITNIYVMSNSATIANRLDITCPTTANGTTPSVVFTANRPYRALGGATWMDACAFLDWAALRPITELEFEKAARGSASTVFAEYAFGSSVYNFAGAGEIDPDQVPEDGTETISDYRANCCGDNVIFTSGDTGVGPLRVGIFAESSTTQRVETGAGYYGAMELSGNVAERTVSIGIPTGRNFAGTHGDGELLSTSSYEGNATNDDWPGYVIDQGVSEATGAGRRGGAYSTGGIGSLDELSISDRTAASGSVAARSASYGVRGARTAP